VKPSRHSPVPILAAAILILLVVAFPAAAEEEVPLEISPCSDCHDNVPHFATNPHMGIAKEPSAEICASCHAGAMTHAESGEPEDVTVPTGMAAEKTCLTCHDPAGLGGAERRAHHDAEIACTTCHDIHGNESVDTVPTVSLLREKPIELCASCHPSQRGAFRRPFGHDLEDGAMTCVSCHSPHGGTRRASLEWGSLGSGPCADCHGEKVGPFVYEHVSGVAGDCMSCHEPHGSSNPNSLVRARVHQLCLECHTTVPAIETLGSQPPSFHDIRLPRYQNCTTCHVTVHGSNVSPALEK
jgi:DmsE family decaheme c-type cytochrome